MKSIFFMYNKNNNNFIMEYTLPIMFDDYEILYNPIIYKYTDTKQTLKIKRNQST